MKHLFLIFALLVLFNSSFACSCYPGLSFCAHHSSYDLTVSGVVTSVFPHGMHVKILNVLHGTESRDTIIVWDRGGPYNMCSDSLGDAQAASGLLPGDTLIIALPKIDTVKSTWDVVGDYKKPDFTCDEFRLRVANSTVTGFISGTFISLACNNCTYSYNYTDFITDFPTKSLNCQTWLGTNDVTASEPLSFYPTPFESSLSFSADFLNRIASITATDIIGQTVPVVVTGNTVSFPTPSASGLYLINTTLSDGNVLSHKVLKQ
jgi:hypothetical protein